MRDSNKKNDRDARLDEAQQPGTPKTPTSAGPGRTIDSKEGVSIEPPHPDTDTTANIDGQRQMPRGIHAPGPVDGTNTTEEEPLETPSDEDTTDQGIDEKNPEA